jgi:hypothetical protein
VTGLVWDRTVSAVSLSVTEARTACAASQVDGQSDWRLPSVVELASILDVTVATGDALIDAAAFPETPAAAFWTSQARAGGTLREQWFINFSFPQLSFTMGTIFANRARCVRTGVAPAGFRLPTVQELLTLVDYTVQNSVNPTPPMIDAIAFPDTPPETFWASSSPSSETGLPYRVNFGNGLTGSDAGKTTGMNAPVWHVRCVR